MATIQERLKAMRPGGTPVNIAVGATPKTDDMSARLKAMRSGGQSDPLMKLAEETVRGNGYVSMADLNRESNGAGAAYRAPGVGTAIPGTGGGRGALENDIGGVNTRRYATAFTPDTGLYLTEEGRKIAEQMQGQADTAYSKLSNYKRAEANDPVEKQRKETNKAFRTSNAFLPLEGGAPEAWDQYNELYDAAVSEDEKLRAMGGRAARELPLTIPKSFASGVVGAVRGLVNEAGYVAQGATKAQMDENAAMWRSMGREDYAQDMEAAKDAQGDMQSWAKFGQPFIQSVAEETAGYGKAGQTLANVAQGVGGMVPSIIANAVAPGSGLPVMFVQAAGNATEEAKAAGASDEAAALYGVAVGGVEVLTEKMFGGIPGLGVGALDDAVENAIKKAVGNEAAQRALLFFMDALGEGVEEFTSEFGDWLLNKWLVKDDNRVFSEVRRDAMYSFLVGALTSIAMQGPVEVYNAIRTDAGRQALAREVADMVGEQISEQTGAEPEANARIAATEADGAAPGIPQEPVNETLMQLAQEMAADQIAQAAPQATEIAPETAPEIPTARDTTPAPITAVEAPRAATQPTRAAQPTADTNRSETPAQAQKKPAARVANPGLIRDENAQKAKLSYTGRRAMDTLAKVLGVNVRFVESINTTNPDGTVRKSGAQGYYDNGEIVIALDGDDPFLTTAVHESVHRIRELSEDDYNYLRDFVVKHMADEQYQRAENAKERTGYTAEEAPEEIIADGFGRMLGNEAMMKQFVAENSTAAQRIMDAFAEILDRIRQALSGKDARSLTDAQLEVYRDLADRLDVMLKYYNDAIANVQESEGAANEDARYNKRNSGAGSQWFVRDKYYDRQIDKWSELKDGARVKVGNVRKGSALNRVGLPDAGMWFDVGNIKKKLAKHGDHLTEAILKSVPDILNDPVVITEYGGAKNTVSVYGNVFVGSTPVVVGVVMHLDSSGQNLINNIRTVHMRGNTASQITDENVLYLNEDKKKVRSWLQVCGIKRVPLDGTKYGLIRSISLDGGKSKPKLSVSDRDVIEKAIAETGKVYNRTVVLKEDTVDKYLKDYAAKSSPKYAQAYIAYMTPDKFLDLTTTAAGRARIANETGPLDLDKLKSSNVGQPIQLIIDHETGDVTGHEGRHRMKALMRAGVENIPVLLFDSSNKYSKTAIDKLVLKGQFDNRAFATVRDMQPLSYENRDAVMQKVATQPTTERLMEKYNGRETVRYSKSDREDLENQKQYESMRTAQSERAVGIYVDNASESASPSAKLSRRSFLASDYVQNRETAAKDLSERLGISVRKAKGYIDAVNSVAKMIADDRMRLDYESSPGRSSFVGNSDYGGSIDFSTICKKRRLLTGTIDAIQNAMPNKVLTADEMLKIRAEMKKRGYEVSCGLCYVEGSRVKIGEYTMQFLEDLKKGDGYIPTMAEMNTAEGQEKLRAEHPEVYDQYVKFMNKLAQRKPKLFQMATEYQGEILQKFKNSNTADKKNLNGGLRLQSFSDFEIIHLIDCMQVILDMSRVGLAGQAYTKVPDFAWALGDTGLKINLSMIAKGVDENGKIIFDEVEGMKLADAQALRERYSKNVGTILVVFNDAQLKAAMADDFVDFIIPFHISQWNKGQYEMLGLPAGTTDYTKQQTEIYLDRRKGKNGKPLRPDDFMSNEYWDFDKTGKENAETYLRMCAEDGRRPVFYKLLDDNGDGTYSLKADGSTDGYWKLLIDFKMYDNAGKGSPQMAVRPNFNMKEAERMLNEYQGGHETFPVAQDVVDDFVNGKFSRSDREVLDEYIKAHGAIKTGENPTRDIPMPKRTTSKTKMSMTVRTVAEAGATPDEFIPTIENLAANHEFDYTPYSDKKAIADADRAAATKGWQTTLTDWVKDVSRGEVSKRNTAIGWALYNNAVNAGDTETALLVLRNVVQHQRNAAQAVQATRILKQLNPETQLYNAERTVENLNDELKKRYGDKVPDLEIDPDLAERFLRARTKEGRDKAMQDIYRDIGRQMPTRFVDRWNAWRYLAMLGNPRTHIRNVVGNAGFAPIVAAKDLTATAIESAVSLVSGGKIGRTKGNVIGRGDLMKAAWNDYENVRGEALGEGKYNDSAIAKKEIQEGRRIFGNTKSKVWNKTGGAALEAVRKANTTALDAEDVWFSKPHYTLALAQYCAANGITAEQISKGQGLAKAREYAIREAQKATYRDTNDFSQAISRLGRGAQWSQNKVTRAISTVIEGILPFRKTPANILARGVEYSPIGLMKSLTYDLVQVRKGNMTAADMIDNISAGLTGTGLLALGAYLVSQGLLRGRGGDDDKKKQFSDLTGHQDYALELPDGTSITLDWLAPEVLPMFIGANLAEIAQNRKDGMKLADILSAIGNVTEPMLEMSCLQSLNNVFEAVGYAKEGDLNALTSALSSAATSYLTQALPTLLGQAERTGETKRMTTYTDKNDFLTGDIQYTIGKASARIPGLDYHQIPYIDAWGREELSGKFIARAANNFVNPSFVSKINESDMEKELVRLYDATGENVFPQRAAKYFNVDGERKDLTADEYLTYATEKGRTSYTVVGGMTGSDLYKDMTDAEKAACVKDAYTYANETARTAVGGKITDSWVEKAQTGVNRGIKPETFIMVRNAVSDVEGIKDAKGKTIDNSSGLQKMEIIYQIPGLNDDQRRYLFECFGVGKTVIGYNKTLVSQKLSEMRKK